MKHEERSRGFKTIAEKVDEKVREAQRARIFKKIPGKKNREIK